MPTWNEIVGEIETHVETHEGRARDALGTARHNYMQRLHEKTGRNIIAYYSGWLSKGSSPAMALADEDKNGFMACIHKMDCSKGLDLILHTPGGDVSATQSLVHYLREKFEDDIRAIVPQIAMSAGTMLACSCKSIVMGRQSNLSPIDPHLGGYSAYTAIEEFNRAVDEVVSADGQIDAVRLAFWQQIIGQYPPTLLTKCEHAINRSNQFVRDQLDAVMFKELKDGAAKAEGVVLALTKHQDGHDMHYHMDECRRMGLKIEELEQDQELQDGVLSVHHAFMHTLLNTDAMKLIENHSRVGMSVQARTA